MLDLLQLKRNICFVFLILIFVFVVFIPGVFALKLSAEPAEFSLEGKVGEEVCKNIEIKSDRAVDVSVEDKWSSFRSRDVKDYKLKGESIGISLYGDKSFLLEKQEVKRFCFQGKKKGEHYGVLIFRGESAGLGIWVNLEFFGNEDKVKINEIQDREKIVLTGYGIKELSDFNGSEVVIGLGLSLILVFILSFLIFKIVSK